MRRRTQDIIHVDGLRLNLTILDGPRGMEAREQPILISLSISHNVFKTASTDDLTYSINYASVCSTLAEYLPRIHHPCLETMADYLFTHLFNLHRDIEEAYITITQVKGPLHPATVTLEATGQRKGSLMPSTSGQLSLRGLKCMAIVGVELHERVRKQPLFFDITIPRKGDSQPKQPFDFFSLSTSLVHQFGPSQFMTLEALASSVAMHVLEHVEEPSEEVTIRVSKPLALPVAEYAQVEITRSRNDFPKVFGVHPIPASLAILPPLIKSITDEADGPRQAFLPVHTVAIALGSNLGDRFANIEIALRLLETPRSLCSDLDENATVSVIDTSFMYETAPMYVTDQPRFANCACLIETNITPRMLLLLVKQVETVVGRVPTIRNGPRAVDLDIVTYGDQIIDTRSDNRKSNLDDLTGELVVPHPRMCEREFVLRPLNDIIPDFLHPVYGRTISSLLDDVLAEQRNDDFPMLKVVPFPKYPFAATSSPSWVFSAPPTATYWTVASTSPTGDPRPHKTHLMATLNATPDSFSDGSMHNALPAAIEYATTSVVSGADIIDIGGYSTRPGAAYVSAEEETNRVIPVINAIRSHEDTQVRDVLISVDTFRWDVAEAAVHAGANCINDVYAFTGPDYPLSRTSAEHLLKMREVARRLCVPVVLMHSRGDAGSNKEYDQYQGGVVEGVRTELGEKVEVIVKGKGGVRRWLVIVDPGIGFSKPVDGQLALLRNASSITADEDGNPLAGYPQLIGSSRKSYLGAVLERPDPVGTYKGRQTLPRERGWATAAAVACAVQQGASVVRVHDVLQMRDVVAVASAVWC